MHALIMTKSNVLMGHDVHTHCINGPRNVFGYNRIIADKALNRGFHNHDLERL